MKEKKRKRKYIVSSILRHRQNGEVSRRRRVRSEGRDRQRRQRKFGIDAVLRMDDMAFIGTEWGDGYYSCARLTS
jgi:hypothetical protein